MRLLGIALAGGLGALARYGLTEAIGSWMQARQMNNAPPFPLATLLINVSGTFLLALLTTLVLQKVAGAEWQLILGVGFLGAFTTFSTFEIEAEALFSQGRHTAAALYVAGNLLLGFGAIFAGRALALRLASTLGAGGA